MGTPEFPDLGKHCSVDDCKLIDFLPFTCDRCKKVFCLQHRSYTTHRCPNADQQDVTVLVCPLCAKGVRLVPNQDPNITWDVHVNTDCDPSNYQKATKKRRCPVPGCRELLTFSNTIRCRDCAQEHCLKHRFGPDHKCPGPKKPDTGGFPFLGSSWWSSVRASAETGMQRLGIGGNLEEHCQQCPAKFSTVAALIDHVERSHGHGGQRTGGGRAARVTVDVCPKCSRAFRDPVLLVEHVEKDHAGTSKA
ncbi:zinc finger AN1 and C2H2 domain-containing stress-associated protein 16-like [Iris pallida]|uniref:Zinc finger AN1 and C2H2 domain-containing stress-associated protein 16-like n=1 Tax=Iris pallida TaxID=29817 RepID=A0AAX6HA00_IRIPA|nr:zinc finger AN1 and C2H2 domain-containing stress-associated protein 16-like [Iris pallida]